MKEDAKGLDEGPLSKVCSWLKLDFLTKMGIALREAKESRAALMKIRLGSLDHFRLVAERELESEAGQLAAIFAAIIRNMR